MHKRCANRKIMRFRNLRFLMSENPEPPKTFPDYDPDNWLLYHDSKIFKPRRFAHIKWYEGYLIAFFSIAMREFMATYCLFMLNSRLGADLFIARPLVFACIC